MQGRSLATRPGFFSLLVFRGITFYTDFLRKNGHVYFQDLSDWKSTKLRYAKPESYFCHMGAYGGSATSQRSTTNADKYWEAAGKWTDLVQKHGPIVPFAKANEFMKKKEISDLMYGVGPLGVMLILGEYFPLRSSPLAYLLFR